VIFSQAAMDGSYSLSTFAGLARTDFAIQLAAWVVASVLRTERFYDATGSFTYWWLILKAYLFANRDRRGIAGLPGASSRDIATRKSEGKDGLDDGVFQRGTNDSPIPSSGASVRQRVVTGMVLAWSLRLGFFLGYRGWKYGDSRFEKIKHKPVSFLIAWLLQGTWCLITPLPAYLLLLRSPADTAPLQASDFAAWGSWLFGFLTEAIADWQKSSWKAVGNTGFIHTGLWRYSQHPNYFGEILLWLSLTLTSCNGQEGWLVKVASFASPAFTSYLLLFVSGIPMLQKAALKKYGKDPAFLAYRARTSLLLPMMPRAA